MHVSVHVVHAFTDGDHGGNPAGIVLNADALTTAQKQTIAREVGLSETAFVSTSKQAPFKLEFFTPTMQIAHCGHATIATFDLLRQSGLVTEGWTAKETIEGNRAIRIADAMAFMEQTAPLYDTPTSQVNDAVMAALGITATEMLPDKAPIIVSTGNRFLIVPLRHQNFLAALAPNHSAVAKLSQEHKLIGFYVFTPIEEPSTGDAFARMFAPAYGIEEEAATGMAAGPLACYLHDKLERHQDAFLIRQGVHMPAPSPSRIVVELQRVDGKITGLLAGGQARQRRTLTLSLD